MEILPDLVGFYAGNASIQTLRKNLRPLQIRPHDLVAMNNGNNISWREI